LAEALKHGLIADASLFSTLVALGHLSPQTDKDREQWRIALRRAVKVKASIVERDERERGERALLNFGHTFGHAFETCGAELLHGEAVALGIALSLEYSACYGELSREALTAAIEALSSVELSIDWRSHLSDAVWSAIALDKKRTSDKLKFIVLREIGEAYIEEVTIEELSSRVKALVHL
jgi:3-dehydroquinate synthetase